MFTPKYLLHHRPCHSELDDIGPTTSFNPVLPPHPDDEMELVPDEQVQKLILCTGKVYWLLIHAIRGRQIKNIATARIEQLAPFPFQDVASIISRFPNARVTWVQEEPKNMGCWTFVQSHLSTTLKRSKDVRCNALHRLIHLDSSSELYRTASFSFAFNGSVQFTHARNEVYRRCCP